MNSGRRGAGAGAAARGAGGGVRGAGGAELARALVALRDARVSGRMPARDVPALRRLLAEWLSVVGGGSPSSYRLRALLRAAGVRASNKVVEGCVARFAPRAVLRPQPFLLALARIHLAHERFRILDTKLKSNPLSLEEMILMTIYS
ncbi:hypothetical protein MSG28_012913 [Choristoneura fumiferana]|uniref:Uncharacterized protein n=1 Tax=Choristoneura fumiferana TaxID=7141 RepID=A0ACC0KSA1_CHOFU|nr:hypothetical protein MSG28_012913 [Choristoneura fumiferana]